MRIDQLPTLPEEALSANVPCTYNGADYQTPMTVNQSGQFYQSGEQIRGTFYGSGFVTTDSQQLTVTLFVPKLFQPSASIGTPSSILVSMRTVGGGYVGTAIGTDMTSIYSSSVCAGAGLTVTLMSSTPLQYGTSGSSRGQIPNNTPVCGYIYINATVN